ncbi:MAG: hypothetical protein CVT83_01500 [Alphaproteobacteria bacterium HGW-Alphaproteobacteria-5]|nr:MAG: hypothetical protein CVT83_01500 [Alphaproteobacteria bacterium HGW-Alphaproteobacteria-5]
MFEIQLCAPISVVRMGATFCQGLPFTWPSVDDNQVFYFRFMRPLLATKKHVFLDNLVREQRR